MKVKNLLSTNDLNRNRLEALFSLSDKIKKDKQAYAQKLNGKIISILFYEPSTRTRLSFESAIIQLGARVISTENARENSAVWKGESIEDTVRTIENYCHAIVLRNGDENAINRAAAVASIPIINAGNGSSEHPTQAILDLYTIRELKGGIDGVSVAIMGDLRYGRTTHSLIKLLALYKDITVYALAIKGLELPEKYIDFLKENNVTFVACSAINQLPAAVDILYQTRLQKERLQDEEVAEVLCINKDILNTFSTSTYLLHPLPREQEIAVDVDSHPRAAYFQQAKNGIPARMALLLTLFGYDD